MFMECMHRHTTKCGSCKGSGRRGRATGTKLCHACKGSKHQVICQAPVGKDPCMHCPRNKPKAQQ